MARFGINTERAFGVSMKALEPLARKYRRNHQLAVDLWASGYHEARLLAALVDDPQEVATQQMDAWAVDFDSWDLCDQACLKLFVRTPFVEEKIAHWVADEREFVRRGGYALLAAYAVHGKAAPDVTFIRLLGLVEEHASDGRNYVRKAVNWRSARSASARKRSMSPRSVLPGAWLRPTTRRRAGSARTR